MNNKLLIIDDNVVICEMYQIYFKNEGFDVKVAYDGLEGINLAITFNPDLILLDIMMPQCDGFEVLETLNTNSSLKTKILVNSNISTEEDKKRAIDLGALKFLNKSEFTPSEILDEIQKALIYEGVETKIQKKILVIEDNTEICEMYKIVLEGKGYDVKLEFNGLNGLTSAIEYKPDLIILDIMMPEINGFEVLESIKSHSDLETIVIVNSNLFSIEDEKKALDLGANKYLRKSYYTPVQVATIVEEILSK